MITVRCSDVFAGYEENISDCVDSDAECEQWAKNNQCLENAYYMREKCHKVRNTLARCFRPFGIGVAFEKNSTALIGFLIAVLWGDSGLHTKGVTQALGRPGNCRWDKCDRLPITFCACV